MDHLLTNNMYCILKSIAKRKFLPSLGGGYEYVSVDIQYVYVSDMCIDVCIQYLQICRYVLVGVTVGAIF